MSYFEWSKIKILLISPFHLLSVVHTVHNYIFCETVEMRSMVTVAIFGK